MFIFKNNSLMLRNKYIVVFWFFYLKKIILIAMANNVLVTRTKAMNRFVCLLSKYSPNERVY